MSWEAELSRRAQATQHALEQFVAESGQTLRDCALECARVFGAGGKLLLCGNGGSAADAQHIAAEFVNRFVIERPPLPAIALTTDTSALTAIGNDYSFDEVFSKQVKALGREGDLMLAISTSGNSSNIVAAIDAARELGMRTIGLTGGNGGRMAQRVDWLLCVGATDETAVIQEVHTFAGHLLCQWIDETLFPSGE